MTGEPHGPRSRPVGMEEPRARGSKTYPFGFFSVFRFFALIMILRATSVAVLVSSSVWLSSHSIVAGSSLTCMLFLFFVSFIFSLPLLPEYLEVPQGTAIVNTFLFPALCPIIRERRNQKRMEKVQFKLTIPSQLRDRLDRLSARCGYEYATEFVTDALDQYAELLADLIKEQLDQAALIRKRQREQLLRPDSQESLSRRK